MPVRAGVSKLEGFSGCAGEDTTRLVQLRNGRVFDAREFRLGDEAARLGVLTAHPDLAGKLAAAKQLTAESTSEQASAGLDMLTDDERATFTDLNSRYVDSFGFPFIIAVRDHNKASILAAFKARLTNSRDAEFAEACYQVERIALHRLQDLLP